MSNCCTFKVYAVGQEAPVHESKDNACFAPVRNYYNKNEHIVRVAVFKNSVPQLTHEEIVEYLEILKNSGLFVITNYVREGEDYYVEVPVGGKTKPVIAMGTLMCIRYMFEKGGYGSDDHTNVVPLFMKITREFPTADIVEALLMSQICIKHPNWNHTLGEWGAKIKSMQQVLDDIKSNKCGDQINHTFSVTNPDMDYSNRGPLDEEWLKMLGQGKYYEVYKAMGGLKEEIKKEEVTHEREDLCAVR